MEDEMLLISNRINELAKANNFKVVITKSLNYLLVYRYDNKVYNIYKYKNHNNIYLNLIDKIIDDSDLINYWKLQNRLYINTYICKACKENSNIYVHFDIDCDPETFCLHSSFLEDEIMASIEE